MVLACHVLVNAVSPCQNGLEMDSNSQPLSDSRWKPGDVINGLFRFDRLVGHALFGSILEVTNVTTGDIFSLERLRPGISLSDEKMESLCAEIRRVSDSSFRWRLKRVGDFKLRNGERYLVLDRFMGVSLASVLEREGSFEPELAVMYLRNLCKSLASLEYERTVHGALTPWTLWIYDPTSSSKSFSISEMGLSSLCDELARSFSREPLSPRDAACVAYRAPEQLGERRGDARSDIWAAGAVLHHMLTGSPPFVGASVPELVERIETMAPPGIQLLDAQLAARLQTVIARAMARRPEDRFQTSAEMTRALDDIFPEPMIDPCDGSDGSIRLPGQPPQPVPDIPWSVPGPAPSAGGEPKSKSNKWWPFK